MILNRPYTTMKKMIIVSNTDIFLTCFLFFLSAVLALETSKPLFLYIGASIFSSMNSKSGISTKAMTIPMTIPEREFTIVEKVLPSVFPWNKR